VRDPSSWLAARVVAAAVAAFGEEHAGVDPLIRRSDRADYQANLAMGLAKTLGRPPREVANALVERLQHDDVCERVEVSGPGFLNLTLRTEVIARELAGALADERLGVANTPHPERVVVDYSAPNVAKEMHVGHLRSTILGDSIVRVLSFLGHDVIRQNHLGDWGTPFGMLVEHLAELGGNDAASDLSAGALSAFYREARRKFDADEAFAERSRLRVVALQRGDEPTLALWRALVAASSRYFEDVYARLGVTLRPADIRGESSYNADLPGVAEELERQGLTRVSDHALCVFPAGFSGRTGEPLPLVVRKTDGGYGYAATDLAAVRHRTGDLKAARLVYVVGAPQAQHLAMVFAVAASAGWLVPPARAEHVAFGSVLGADGKMFKTRAGDTVRLVDLLTEAVARAEAIVTEKSPGLDEAARREIARAVGLGAVKYADLANDRIKDYVFDWDRMLATEGNTGPYLQYAHARICSVLRRAGGATSPETSGISLSLAETAERELALQLLQFGSAVELVARELKPHHLCTYLFALATRFTAFYERCPVLKAESAELRASRVVLCAITARVLGCGLSLLGIEAPPRL
jgi:arginyl-tRNA synthetase